MANIKARDEGGNVIELKAIGTGTTADPFEYASTTQSNILTALGTDSTSASQLAGGVGLRGWLSGLFLKVTDVITNLGTDATSATQVTGGAGIRGWLSSIFVKVTELITATSNAGKASSISIDSTTTSTTGSSFVALTAGACTEIVLNNAEATAVDIRYQRGGTGESMLVPAGAIAVIEGITNSSNIGIRRADQSNAQVTISFERKTR